MQRVQGISAEAMTALNESAIPLDHVRCFMDTMQIPRMRTGGLSGAVSFAYSKTRLFVSPSTFLL